MTRKFLVPIVLPADPAAAMEAATKQYVDNRPAGDEVYIGTADPGAAYELWYDTDEPNLYDPDTARWNSAWGVVATFVYATDITNITTTETWVNSGTFTAVAGRKYSLVVRQHAQQSVGADGFFLRAVIDGVLVLFVIPENTTAPKVYHLPTITYSATTSGSKQVYVSLQRWSGTGFITASNFTYANAVTTVYDVGPVSLASNPPAQPASVWTAPTLLNGWTSQPGSQAVQYRKIGDVVYIRGLGNPGGATSGQVAFVLPVGYRVPAPMQISTGSYNGTWIIARYDLTPDGNVVPVDGVAPYYAFHVNFSVTS